MNDTTQHPPRQRTRRTLIMLGALYVSQGLPIGLGFVALPVILRAQGVSLQMIGMLGLLVLPWAVKFLWAPWVDRFDGGRLGPRRSWIVPMQVGLAAILFVIALLPQSDGVGAWMLALLFLANTLSATQDIATDGLAIELLQGRALGWANALQIGGFSVGMMLGGALTVTLYEHGGQALTFVILGALVLLCTAPVIGGPDATRQPCAAGPEGSGARHASLWRMLARPGAGWAILVAATFFFATTMKGSMIGPLMVDGGLSMSEIGTINGAGTLCIALFSAPFGSLLIERFGVRRVAWIAGLLSACSILLWLLPATGLKLDFNLALAVDLINSVAAGVAYVAFFTLFMRWASTEQAGTDFTVLQCTEQVFNIGAGMLAGMLAGWLGYASLFICTAGLGLVLMIVIGIALKRMPLREGNHPSANTALEVRNA
ncbi:MFS transporter [Pseudomonas cremoricolorata]|uniref:MFS transporter n=1 Tax=Pseudomonas cremoricolorata TaxID=157783 RepID=UPI000417E594|nr:MFS transporter [Pseudomonas cremoricolorata]